MTGATGGRKMIVSHQETLTPERFLPNSVPGKREKHMCSSTYFWVWRLLDKHNQISYNLVVFLRVNGLFDDGEQ